jgi:hypothetical protein
VKAAQRHPLEKWLPSDPKLREALLRLEEEGDEVCLQGTLEERLDRADREASAGLTYGPMDVTEFREFFGKWQSLYGRKPASGTRKARRVRRSDTRKKTDK